MPSVRSRAAAVDRRVGLIFLIFLALLGIAVVRALYLGTVKASTLRQAAFTEQISDDPVPATRGTITDVNGVQLALTESTSDVVADPYLVISQGHPQQEAQQIATLLQMSSQTVLAALIKPHTGYSPIAKQVTPAVAQRILKLRVGGQPINGISITSDIRRVYPRASTLAQVIGAVNHTDQGISGLESTFNGPLAGRAGEQRIVNGGNGRPIEVQDVKTMEPGKALTLTISAPLQAEMEQVLAGVAEQWQPKLATAIALDPSTGAILGLANWPSVNANDPFQGTEAQVNNAIQDHALSFSYEPGSTFKAITVAGALQDGLITPSTSFTIPPDLAAYGSVIHDAESHGYEQLTTAGILRVSSNIGADLIGAKLGPTRFNGWVRRFGLGKPTGVDLPGEDSGFILSPSAYSGTSMLNLPFGQGESVTPIQMAEAYTAIADGGILRTPHIVSAIGGRAQPTPAGHRIISSSIASEIRDMLRGVLSDTGTASGAQIPGYDLAGKTGTAEIAINGKYSDSEYVASFIGMVPASNPRLVVAVVVDDPRGNIYGGSVAAPAFQKIVGWAVPYFGINPNPAGVDTNPADLTPNP